MRVNAAIVASLTGAAFAYPVLDSYKEVKEVPAYGVDPKAPAYTAHDVYGNKPAHSSHTSAPKAKQETSKPKISKQEKTKETAIVEQKQAVDDCISKRNALGLDFSACTKGALSGSLGASQPSIPPKVPTIPSKVPAVPEPFSDLTDASEPELPSAPTDSILSNPFDVLLPLGGITSDRANGEASGSAFNLPIETTLKQLLPSGEDDAENPDSDPVSAVSNAAGQLQRSGVLPKRFVREVRPSFDADAKAESALSGNASADEESTSFNLAGSLAGAATATESLEARQDVDDDDDDAQSEFSGPKGPVNGVAQSVAEAANEARKSTNGFLPSLTGAQIESGVESEFSASASAKTQDMIKREAQFSLDAVTALLAPLTGAPAAKPGAPAKRQLDAITALLAPLTGAPAAKPGAPAKRQLDAITALLAPLTGAPAAKPGAPAKRDLDLPGFGTTDFLFKSEVEGEVESELSSSAKTQDVDEATGAPAKRQLDAITALLAPLTGAPAKPGAPAKRSDDMDLDFLGAAGHENEDDLGPAFLSTIGAKVKGEVEGQLTTSTSTAAEPAGLDKAADDVVKRYAQLALDAAALLAPLTGAPAASGTPAKRQLDAITALLAPLTGAPAKPGAPAKRQLGLDAVTGLLAPITGAPAPAAGAPAKRQLDIITALLAPLTGAPAKPGAPAKRQLGLDAVTGLLAPVTGAPAPGAPAKQ